MTSTQVIFTLSQDDSFSNTLFPALDKAAQISGGQFSCSLFQPQEKKNLSSVLREQEPAAALLDLDHLPPFWEEFSQLLEEIHPHVPLIGVTSKNPFPEKDSLPLDLTITRPEINGSFFARTIPAVIKNKQLELSTSKDLYYLNSRLAEYKAICQASLNLTSDLELEPVLANILKSALKLVPADDAHIFLYDGKELAFGAALFNGEEQKEPFSNPRSDGLTATVARSGEKIVVNQVEDHPLFENTPWNGSIVGIPLLVGQQVLGVMNIAFHSTHAFKDRELELLNRLAAQAAAAIHNAHLYELAQQEIRERRQAEKALRESEKRYRMLFDSSKDAIMLLSPPSWKFTSGNQSLVDMFQLEGLDQLCSLGPGDLSPPFQPDGQPSASKSLMMIQQALEEGSLFFEWTHARTTGETFPATVLLTRVDLGKEFFLQATVRDITKRKQTEQALKQSEEKLRRIVQGTDALMININPRGKVTYFNEAVSSFLGKKAQDILGQSFLRFIHPRDRERVRSSYLDSLHTGNTTSLEFRVIGEENQTRWVRFVNHPLYEKDQIVGQAGIALDITKSIELERKAEERRLYLEGLLQAALDAIVTSDNEGTVLEWNTGAENLFGYRREEAVGKNVDELITRPNLEITREAQALSSQVMDRKNLPPTETIRYRKDGSSVHVVLTAAPILIEGEVVGGVATYTDITPQKEMEKAIKHMATHDSLTGLPNRRLFNDRIVLEISHAQRREEKVAVVLMDLDLFKEINDTLGHNIGDKMLQAVGNRLTQILRKSDTVARMGGDEFMLILPEIKEISAIESSLSRLLEALQSPFLIEGNQLKISTSIGVSFYPDDGVDVDTLVKKADIAMYRAKERGGSQFQFYQPPDN